MGFFRDVLQLSSVDTDDGWLILALPPAELCIHPTEGSAPNGLFFVSDNIEVTVKELKSRGVEFTRIIEEERCKMYPVTIPFAS